MVNHQHEPGPAGVSESTGGKPFPRQGAFCVLDRKVGIIYEWPQTNPTGGSGIVSTDHSSAVVHFIDAKGETAEQVRNVPIGALRQAKLAEIPKSRRPTEAVAKKFGYR